MQIPARFALTHGRLTPWQRLYAEGNGFQNYERKKKWQGCSKY